MVRDPAFFILDFNGMSSIFHFTALLRFRMPALSALDIPLNLFAG